MLVRFLLELKSTGLDPLTQSMLLTVLPPTMLRLSIMKLIDGSLDV